MGDINQLNLRVLNEIKPNVLQYLPYGATTLEIKIEGNQDELLGYVYPNKVADQEKKLFLGFADQSEDFLVLWGGGSERGLKVTSENVNGRLFFQFLHRGNTTTDTQSITLCHTGQDMPNTTIKLVPAENSTNLVRMQMFPTKEGSESDVISFRGSKVPLYYPRWFPPRPSENKKIEYSDIDVPNIMIKFKVKESAFIPQVDSDIDIFLNDDPNPIVRISEDWRYSSLHAELFTIFGDSDYLILRLWCYWVNANFSFGGSINIECPDFERFDFLIEMKKKKVTYVGTDFHYQEWWYKIDDGEDFTRAKIAGGIWTIERTLMGLKERFDTKENFDPMNLLKVMLKQETTAMSPMKILREYIQSNRSKMGPNKAAGFFGKHIPYPENGRPVADLVSSVVTS